MIELQIVNKLLDEKSLLLLIQNNITSEYFISYKSEIEFILNHNLKYSKVPDKETFLSQFQDFDVVEVNESDTYLVETLQEQYLYTRLVPVVHKVAEMTRQNSEEAVEYMRQQVEELAKLKVGKNLGVDIIKNALDRKADYERRLSCQGLLGITSGIKALDEITHGWMPEDFVPIVGRTSEGKTWVLLFFLVAAWNDKKRVLLYSGEMSKNIVGFRFDTLNKHFSNLGLMRGKEDLGIDEDYSSYLEELSKLDSAFIVVTPNDLGGKRLTIGALHQLIETYKPDIIGIDQLSLMDDNRKTSGDPKRLQYTHLAEDLFLTSEKYGIPILSPAQASRKSTEDKKTKDNPPELEHISESDGIPQNATRVISIKQVETTLKIALKKNRYGLDNQEILTVWDIDSGYIKPFLQASTDENGVAIDSEQLSEGADLF